MKFRYLIFLVIGTVLLSACNMTLAADVTPPPNYVPPTPIPTLGALHPPAAPDVENGKAIFVEKCAPCHGDTGLGDGEQGKQLPVTVIPIGLPEYGSKAAPSRWYTVVTQGNIDRFMPPFSSLSEQERWDVVAYALTLHTTEEQIETGKTLFEENCADCGDLFTNQEMMSALSEEDIVRMVREGGNNVPAFGSNLSDEEVYAVAAYIRTLTFALPSAPVAAAVTETPAAAETESATDTAETPSAEATASEGTPQAEVTEEVLATEEPAANVSKVTGWVDNRTGKDLSSDTTITLRGFDHGTNPSAGPQEFLSIPGTVNADGSYSFETELAENEIYLTELVVDGLTYQSEFAVVQAGVTELELSDIIVYETTDDYSSLQVAALQIFFDLASEDTAQVFAVYSIVNNTEKTIVIDMGNDQNIPFIAFPDGANGLGYEATQDSAGFVATDTGFAMPPSETPYGLIAFSSLPRSKEIVISQPALLAIAGATLLLPEGVEAEGESLTDGGVQNMQGTNFHVYTSGAMSKGETLEFTLSGKPTGTAENADPTQNQNLLIGVGAFGVVLIVAGVWMYLREKNKVEEFDEDEEDEDEYQDAESVMDAIIALDDLHRTGKITDEAYQQRRDELKDTLKRKG